MSTNGKDKKVKAMALQLPEALRAEMQFAARLRGHKVTADWAVKVLALAAREIVREHLINDDSPRDDAYTALHEWSERLMAGPLDGSES